MIDKASILQEVQKHIAKGALDKAISVLEKLADESPDGNTFNMIGDIHLKKGDKNSAIDYYQKAANYFRQEGFSQKAQALYKKILNIDPIDTDALYAFGQLSEERGLVTDAIKYYLAVADLISKKGEKEKILDIYVKIISLSPSNIPLRTKVAEIFLKEGLRSDSATEYVQVASIYIEKDDFQKAKECFMRALDIQPLSKEAALGLNHLLEKTGEILQAAEQIKEAAILFPEDTVILLRYAEVSLLSGAAGTAKELLGRIINMEPGNVRARKMLGELYLKAGAREKSWEQFVPVLDKALSDLSDKDAITFLNTFRDVDPLETGKRLARLFRELGENERAAEELIALGDFYAEKGLEDDARSSFNEALQADPLNQSAEQRLKLTETGPVKPETPIESGSSLWETEEPELPSDVTSEPGIVETPESRVHWDDETADQIVIRGDKSFDEIMTEADIFFRYGLLSEAQRLLEGLKPRFPDNLEMHLRLKSVYTDLHHAEDAVTECLILSELYRRKDDLQSSEQMIQDALAIGPSDPRLAERGFQDIIERTSYAAGSEAKGPDSAVASFERDIGDYEEEIAEADFYARQGLTGEAVNILEKLHRLFPENREVNERLQALGQTAADSGYGELSGSEELPETYELPETIDMAGEGMFRNFFEQADGPGIELPPDYKAAESTLKSKEEDTTFDGPSEISLPDVHVQPQVPAETDIDDFTMPALDLEDAQEMPEPALDNDVLEIFQEFKRGIEKELKDEDSETHYNLGIAYKEMGLIDDAIKEFQTSRNDPSKFIQSSTMLGICYMEKGLYPLAIDVLNKALGEIKEKNEMFWAITYDIAEAYEKDRNLKEALDLYTKVYGWNAGFRDVSNKMDRLRAKALKAADKDAQEKPKERKNRVSYL
jgi:tetratricopeptide (TPR) repeat protein